MNAQNKVRTVEFMIVYHIFLGTLGTIVDRDNGYFDSVILQRLRGGWGNGPTP